MWDLEADIEDPDDRGGDDNAALADTDTTVSTQTVRGPPDMALTCAAESGRPDSNVLYTDNDENLAQAASRMLSIEGDHALTPVTTSVSDPTSTASSATTSLLGRRGVPPMPSPFAGTERLRVARSTSENVELLRPNTPTEPHVEAPDHTDITPTAEQLSTDGPLTPTNNAGPFVFDGSAGRADNRRRASRESGSPISR